MYQSITNFQCILPAFVLPGSILKHQEDLFAAELHRLKQQPLFSLVDFENLIDGIRSTVAEVGFILTLTLTINVGVGQSGDVS